jgi:putative oligomerization/nucleic acid binding protein
MKSSAPSKAVAFLAIALAGLVGCGKSSTNTAHEDSLAALKNLRDRGVLTQQEYDAKVATVAGRDEALKALKSLRDQGVFTQQEYEAKVATLQGASGLGDTSSGGPGVLAAGPTAGLPDNGAAGLGTGGSELSVGAPAQVETAPRAPPRAARKTPRPAHQRELTLGDSQPIELAAAPEGSNGAPQSGSASSEDNKSHTNPVASLWARARAKAHDLEGKILHRASQTPPPGNPDPKALESYGQTLLNGNGSSDGQDYQGASQQQPR